MGIRRISLRFSLASVLIGVVLATSIALGGGVYAMWRRSLRANLGTRLHDLVATAVLLVEPGAHARVVRTEDMDGVDYRALRERLIALRGAVPDIHFLYTYRWTPGEEAPRFVLDTGAGKHFSPTGHVYRSATARLRAAFTPPYRVTVETDFYSDEYGTFLSAYAPILDVDGRLEGVLGVDLDASAVQTLERRLLALVSVLTLVIAAIMVLGAWWLSRWFGASLHVLSRDMERVQKLDLDGGVAITSRISEIVTMVEAFDNMKRGLRSFRKYVPRELVAELIALKKEAVLGTQRAEVTIFFCDLAGFTTASEKLTPEDLTFVLGGYFELVTRCLQAHGATVDKFIGDAVMAFWNAPESQPDHAWRAAKSAVEIARGMAELARSWEARGLPGLKIRIGLNTGIVQVGNVGHQDRLSYTVLGDPVNLASRLENLNKYYGTTVIAANTTLAGVGARLPTRVIDIVAVKGRTQAIEVSELADEEPVWWAAHRAAFALYRERKWRAAAEAFEAVRAGDGPDGASMVLAARCRRFRDGDISADFDGTWVMQDK